MDPIKVYLNASERANTRRSYASALRHFEIGWGGLLPATIDSISRYLSDHAKILSANTLKHRLAALSRWHQDHGFTDPTKAVKIRQLLKGIRALHPTQEKRAKPIELDILQNVCNWLENATNVAKAKGNTVGALRHTRNRALILLGFWRGFRSDELSNLRIEFIEITPREGLICYLPRSKGDRQLDGRSFPCPALSRLCPVEAVESWLILSKLKEGPLFRKIDHWGHLKDTGLLAGSIIPILRQVLVQAGTSDAQSFSSHSLRRGFAHWANQSGWSLQELMNYVGWRDVKAAMRYLEGSSKDLKARFEQGLDQMLPTTIDASLQKRVPELPSLPTVPTTAIEISLQLLTYNGNRRRQARILREMMDNCLVRFQAQPVDSEGTRYRIAIPNPSPDVLDDYLYTLLDDLHQIADARECFLEAVCRDSVSGKHWD